MLLISIITSPRYRYTGIHHARAATGGTAPGRADGSHSGGNEEKSRWGSDNMCVCGQGGGVVGLWWYRKTSGGIGFWRQASWQAYAPLITQGLPPPLGAVSYMRGRNQPLKNRSPPQSSTESVQAVQALACGSGLNWRFFFGLILGFELWVKHIQ